MSALQRLEGNIQIILITLQCLSPYERLLKLKSAFGNITYKYMMQI